MNLADAEVIYRSLQIEAKNLALLRATAEVFYKGVSVEDTNSVLPCSH